MLDFYTVFLKRHSIDQMGHSDDTLLSHLVSVHQLLLSWKSSPDLCTAGLFHSVYGTESYRAAALSLSLRDEVSALIGERAENLAYLFGAMEKNSLYANLSIEQGPHEIGDRFTGKGRRLTQSEMNDLCVLVVANWLEQRPRVAVQHQYIRSAEFEQMLPFLSANAREALVDAYGFAPAPRSLADGDTTG